MKIKQEKPSFSDVEPESDSEPEIISPSKIKVDPDQSVVSDENDDASEEDDNSDTGAEDTQGHEPTLGNFVRAWSGEENLKSLEAVLNQITFHGPMELMLKEYFHQFSHVKPLLPAKSWVDIDLANADEDTWIIQCPASVDVRSVLLNKKLNLAATCSRIKHCSVPLEAHVKQNTGDQAIGLMCGTRIKSFCPTGYVRITEQIPDAPVEVELSTESSHVEIPFPEDIPQRHPLLGYDFRETMTLSDRVKTRLDLAQKKAAQFYTNLVPSGTTKKSKRIKQEPGTVTVKMEPESDREMETVSPKKAKRRREATVEPATTVDEATPRKVIKLEETSTKKKSKNNKVEYNTSTSTKEVAVEDDIAWLLNI